MAPLPKKKHTRRQRGQNNAHNAVRIPATTTCAGCRETILLHRACPHCGNYKGRTIPGNFALDNLAERRQTAATATENSGS
jgi:large subunit ribosomal protein L32